jgi:NTP pyrophosphatase (non-canonical NTP hydrolase)
MTIGWTFRNLQDEQAPWVLHNFGKRPPWQPLLGIAEELGELQIALENGFDELGVRREEIKDSIADTIIFMADFCTSQAFDLETIFRSSLKSGLPSTHHATKMLISYGRLAHSFLKKEQGIRGLAVEHDRDAALRMTEIIVGLRAICKVYALGDLHTMTREVWEWVRQRDWKKNAATGEAT